MSLLGDIPAETAIAGYRIERVLGRGGMGVVYRASHPRHDAPVALKLIAPGSAWDNEARERFQRESRLAGAVSHRHILPVYEAGESEGVLFVAMKCVEGADLGARLRREGRLPPADAISIVAQIASALDAAHAHGLVHRDIKPENVLLGEEDEAGAAYLADFGVTRVAFSGGPTSAGDMVGTVGYASPEQIRGEPVDLRSDVYSLGCLLHECLTGHVPFQRADTIATLWAHLHDEPQAPSALAPELPVALDDVVRRALAKSPHARYGSAGALARAAQTALGPAPEPHEPSRREAPGLPSGLVTFLFTDVEGSTRLVRELGVEAYAEVLEEHRRLLRGCFGRHGGVEVDMQGDTFCVAFASAVDALECAGESQAALGRGLIRVRMGVHTGTPHVTSEGYVGVDVDRAARIMSAAHGGQVVVSEATVARFGDGFALSPLGAHRLKDFDQPVSLFQLGEGEFPALKTITNTSLPAPASSFLGREAELVEADWLLQTARLLTVAGPGGAGKTRFALELARRAREERFGDYPDGVFSCFLASLRDPGLVLTSICQTLNVREQPDLTALEALSAHLRGKRMLLLVDNLEHLLASAGGLSQLLTQTAGLTLLVTSRETLRISGETGYQLPPLADDEGVQLFCERARTEPTPTIRQLCQRLDGLPLAIELAAARTNLLTPDQLHDRLSQRLDLRKGPRDADPRQQTLRATIEWSHELLNPEEQQLFARLSVFSGGSTLEAAEAVCDATLDTLQSLLDKNLIRHTNHRFSMLQTIRDYATERLEQTGEVSEIRQRHADWYLALAEEGEQALRGGPDQRDWLDRLEAEYDNLRAVFDWAAAQDDSELTVRLASALGLFWESRGYLSEGRRRLTALVAGRPDPVPAKLVHWAGRLALQQADHQSALPLLERSLSLAREQADGELISLSLSALSLIASCHGDREQGRLLAEESVAVARADENPWALAEAFNCLGAALCESDPTNSEGMRAYDESITQRRAIGDRLMLAVPLHNIAFQALRAGDHARADTLYGECLAIAEEFGDRRMEAAARANLAGVTLALGNEPEAVLRYHQTLTLAGELGMTDLCAQCLFGLAVVLVHQHELEQAAWLYGCAEATISRVGSPRGAVEQRLVEAVLSGLRTSPDFAAAYDKGTRLTIDAAVETALATRRGTNSGQGK